VEYMGPDESLSGTRMKGGKEKRRTGPQKGKERRKKKRKLKKRGEDIAGPKGTGGNERKGHFFLEPSETGSGGSLAPREEEVQRGAPRESDTQGNAFPKQSA